MRGVRRQIKHKQTSTLPTQQPLPDELSRMNPRTIQHHHRLFLHSPGQIFELLSHKLGINAGGCGCPMALIAPANQTKTVQMVTSLGQYTDRFARKLPAVRYVALTANSALVPIQQVNLVVSGQRFQDRQSLQPISVKVWAGLLLYSFADTFVTSTTLFKNERNAPRLTVLPCWASHSALAVCSRWRSALMASKAAS